MAKSEKRKTFSAMDFDLLIALGLGAVAVGALRYFNGPAEWWVYLVIFLVVAVITHHGVVKARGDMNQAYKKDA